MKIEVLGSFGGESLNRRMTCLLINETVALDAGSLSEALPIERQRKVRSIVLTHSHIDHVSSLPFFVENVFGRTQPIKVHGSAATIFAIRKNLFNNAIWPDFTRLPNNLLPSIEFVELAEETPRIIQGVKFTPFLVDHVVSTFGYLIEHEGSTVVWSSDTGPTVRLWELANRASNVKGIMLDTSFDNSLQQIADLSLHLTPQTMSRELQKLEVDLPIFLHHLKPPCIEAIVAEVQALKNPAIRFLEQGRIYEF